MTPPSDCARTRPPRRRYDDDEHRDPTTDEGTGESELGRARRRKEDEHLITGRTRWTDNIVLPGMLHAAILRSPVAHARITGLDVSEARGKPGVVAVYTGADLAEEQGSLPCACRSPRT